MKINHCIDQTLKSSPSNTKRFYELLSSMRFAVSLLTVLGIASIIGTVLKQNEPYSNYIIQFGQFWFAFLKAWGGYWSWDPKETWALIVWLNYIAWLHLRMVKGFRGLMLAWWALIGLLVTTFAFLGVNMFLSGLHSYGKL